MNARARRHNEQQADVGCRAPCCSACERAIGGARKGAGAGARVRPGRAGGRADGVGEREGERLADLADDDDDRRAAGVVLRASLRSARRERLTDGRGCANEWRASGEGWGGRGRETESDAAALLPTLRVQRGRDTRERGRHEAMEGGKGAGVPTGRAAGGRESQGQPRCGEERRRQRRVRDQNLRGERRRGGGGTNGTDGTIAAARDGEREAREGRPRSNGGELPSKLNFKLQRQKN